MKHPRHSPNTCCERQAVCNASVMEDTASRRRRGKPSCGLRLSCKNQLRIGPQLRQPAVPRQGRGEVPRELAVPEIQGDDQLYVEMEALAAAAQPPPWDGGRGKPP